MTEAISPDKAVYQTMVEPKPETIQYLTGWQRPRGAYVLFETKEWHIKGQGYKVPGTGLCTLDVEGRPSQEHKVDAYLLKGFRILDYGNFPKLNDNNPKRAARAKLYSAGSGINAWDQLESHVKSKMGFDPDWKTNKKKTDAELAAKDKELAEKDAELAALQRKVKEAEKLQQKNAPAAAVEGKDR